MQCCLKAIFIQCWYHQNDNNCESWAHSVSSSFELMFHLDLATVDGPWFRFTVVNLENVIMVGLERILNDSYSFFLNCGNKISEIKKKSLKQMFFSSPWNRIDHFNSQLFHCWWMKYIKVIRKSNFFSIYAQPKKLFILMCGRSNG